MATREYTGPAIDGTYQYITERPELENTETVYVTDPEPAGEETTENVPVPGDAEAEGDLEGQTSLTDWGGECGD